MQSESRGPPSQQWPLLCSMLLLPITPDGSRSDSGTEGIDADAQGAASGGADSLTTVGQHRWVSTPFGWGIFRIFLFVICKKTTFHLCIVWQQIGCLLLRLLMIKFRCGNFGSTQTALWETEHFETIQEARFRIVKFRIVKSHMWKQGWIHG